MTKYDTETDRRLPLLPYRVPSKLSLNKHTANKFAVLDRENVIAKLKCKNKIQAMLLNMLTTTMYHNEIIIMRYCVIQRYSITKSL